jgi:hypothetical protein
VTTSLVADPRERFHEHIEQTVIEYGVEASGQPRLVLPPDATTAKVWSRRNVPVVLDDDDDHVDVAGLMVTVVAILDRD